MGSCASQQNKPKKPKIEVTAQKSSSQPILTKSENKVNATTPITKSLQFETNNESIISKRSSVRITEKKNNLENIKKGLFTIYTKLNQKNLNEENEFQDGQILILQHNVSGLKKRTEVVLKYGIRSKSLIKSILEKKQLSNEYICQISDIYQDQECYYLLQDYCSGGNMDEIKQNFTEEQVIIILVQMISAISYLHSHKLTHGNLTTKSFSFLNNCKNLFCKLVEISPIFYKDNYIQIEPTQNDYNKDIYSIGSIAYEILFKQKPKLISVKQDNQNSNSNVKKIIDFPSQINPIIKKVLTQMICQEQQEDINLEQIKKQLQKIINNKFQKESLIQPLYCLSQCKQRNYFHTIILSIMINKFMQEDEIILKKIFDDADLDKDGFLTSKDLTRLYKSVIEYENIDIDVEQLLDKVDVNKSGKIDQLEFITATINVKELIQNDYLETLFKQIQNQHSRLSVSSLKKFSNFDEKLLNEVLMDLRGQTRIQFWEFREIMEEIV